MSECNVVNSPETEHQRRRDAGFTLPELLVSIIVLGSIVAVLSSAIIVTFKQQDNTEGRLNVSRAEQNVSLWIPADLASADEIPSTEPSDSPCSVSVDITAGCPANVVEVMKGSNALMLTWSDIVSTVSGPVTVTTNVSYHFTPGDNGLFDLIRIECHSTEGGPWSCEIYTVLQDLPGPPPPEAFDPGVTRPTWVIIVSAPLPPDATDPDATPETTLPNTKNANRVVVTINGGGDAGGRGGGINQISITAGGTRRSELPPRSPQGALSFLQTQSRCGGPVALVVDESNSIGSAITSVKAGVTKFVETFAGTPVQLQIVRFHTTSSVLGDPTAWSKYYDMTNPADVTALLSAVNQLQGSWSGGVNGGTNWEDALFRTFQGPDGSVLPVIPKTVVFFTDGVPTFDRLVHRGSPGQLTAEPAAPGPGWPTSTGSAYSQVAFNRANYYATKWRSGSETKLIGVGIGTGIASSSGWMANPQVGFHIDYQARTAWTYQARYQSRQTWTYQKASSWTYQKASSWTYQRYWSGSWVNTTSTQYNNNNYTIDESDGWRRIPSGTSWSSSTSTEYNNNNYTIDQSDGWRRIQSGTSWSSSTSTEYNNNNYTVDQSDGWRKVGSGSWVNITKADFDANNYTSDETDGYRNSTWATATQTEYDTNNTTPDESDGWRKTSPSGPWVNVTKDEFDDYNTTTTESDGYRTVEVFAPPYTDFKPKIETTTANQTILARLIAGSDNGVLGQWSAAQGRYTNAAEANMYISPDWSQFTKALEAVALGECGGTLTIQTKLAGAPAVDPFSYQNSGVKDSAGDPLTITPTLVTTNLTDRARTFDFDISDGTFRTVEIRPYDLSDLTGYTGGTWSCRAGIDDRTIETFPIDGTPWSGFRVRVGANEAVSCIHAVTAS